MNPTDDEIRAQAIEQILVESTMDPFHLGPCYVTGPIDFAKKHSGEPLQVTEQQLEGVFEQLLDRVLARLPDTIKRVNERCDEVLRLRAENAKMRALLVDIDKRGMEHASECYHDEGCVCGVLDLQRRINEVTTSQQVKGW